MDAKDMLISAGGLHPAMNDPQVQAIMTDLVARMRENMETMLPAFPYKSAEERQSAIEQALIVYGWGIRDGIEEWIKQKQLQVTRENLNELVQLQREGVIEAMTYDVARDPDIPRHPYCRQCLDREKLKAMLATFGDERGREWFDQWNKGKDKKK